MTYAKQDCLITTRRLDNRSRPGLWIGQGNQLLKVASFGNVEKARLFEKWLAFFFSNEPITEDITDGQRKG